MTIRYAYRASGLRGLTILMVLVFAARPAEAAPGIIVDVNPGESYEGNVGLGLGLLTNAATQFDLLLNSSSGTIVRSDVLSQPGTIWKKVKLNAQWQEDPNGTESQTHWRCTGIDPNDPFWCIIRCTMTYPGPGGGGGEVYRWMSVSDVDFDADTDNNRAAAHRPPSRSLDEDYNEYPGVLVIDPIGLVIPIDDDNQVETRMRDGGLSAMNYDTDSEVLDAILEIHPKKAGAWDKGFPCVTLYTEDGTNVGSANRRLNQNQSSTINLRLKSNWNIASGTKESGLVIFQPDAPNNAYWPRDAMQYIFLGCDIDVDSDNDGQIAPSNENETGEDLLEALPTGDNQYAIHPECKYGMIVSANDAQNLRPLVLHGLGVSSGVDKTSLEEHQPVLRIRKVSGDGAVRLFTAADHVFIGMFASNTDPVDEFGGQSNWQRLYNSDMNVLVEGLCPGEVMLAYQLVLNNVLIHQDVVRITVVKVDLQAANSTELTEETPGTPLLLNDDWDCGEKYGAGEGGGHLEKEPIGDKDYTTAQVPTEDDLMKVTIASVSPATLPGNVTLRIILGADKIKLWPRATKGNDAEIITLPGGIRTYAISALPQDLYVEGVALGRAVMTLEYTLASRTISDTVNIDVVTLQATQGGTRNVINDYNSDITFAVQPSSLPAEYTYLWDLDGDGTRKNGAWESSTARETTVKYSSASSSAVNIQLVKSADNRRKEYTVSVRVTSGGLDQGGLVASRRIRVALDSYEGAAVASTEADRRTEVAGLTTPPSGFSNTPPGDATVMHSQAWFEATWGVEVSPPGTAINDGNRLQYSTSTAGYGATRFDGMGNGRRVFVSMVCKKAYDDGLKQEDLQAIARHECNHAAQHIDVKQTGTVWRRLDDYYGSQDGYSVFREADSYCVDLESNASWLYARTTLSRFDNQYTDALNACTDITEPTTKASARARLQNIYERLPFIEMKRSDYFPHVRAPQ